MGQQREKQASTAEQRTISGRVDWVSEERFFLSVWSKQQQKNHTISIEGHLDGNVGEHWEIKAVPDGNNWRLQSGKLLLKQLTFGR